MSLNIGLAGKHIGVHELYGGDGAMLVYRVSNRCQVRYAVVTVELEVFGDINAVYRVSCMPRPHGWTTAQPPRLASHEAEYAISGSVAIFSTVRSQ